MTEPLTKFRDELSVKSKNGIDFISAATIVWGAMSFIWTLDFHSYHKSILVLITGGLLLPIAFFFSKLLKTNWKIEGNSLQPLGLWLNFAQLFYFPFLILALIKMPDYFIIVYAIITGGHLFPYAWFYKAKWYAIFAGIIVLGALITGLILPIDKMYCVPVFTSASLFILVICLYSDVTKKTKLSASE